MADTRMRILCLEQGEWMNPAQYPSTGRDGELRHLREFSFNPNVRGRATDYPVNGSASPIQIANFNGVGGGTVLYAAHFPRFHPSDFRVRTCDGVADDWPVDYATLEPFFAENDRMMGVAGLAGDPAYPPKAVPLPPVPLGASGERLAAAFNQLGWHWWPSDSAIATRPYEGRDRCVNLGPCTSGCAQGAKGSTDITYWPEAIRRGVQLRTRARVREITVGADGMANGAVYYDEHGREQFQAAHVVVLACNGIGTPRLMLNSVSGRFPNGIANSSGQVGRNLMLHPYASVMGTFPERLDGQFGPAGCCIWSQEFYETDRARGFVRGYTMEIIRGRGALTTAMNGLASGQIPWGPGFHEAFGRLFAHSAGMVAILEDLPEAHNRVTLDPVLKDGDGIPAPAIHYTLSENSRRMLDHAVARATEVLRAAGATEVHAEAPWRAAGWHNMGTARMGSDPARSVVDARGRAHDVKNLFIIDGSIFVTSGGVNPTSTIQALALYIADGMKRNLANLFD
ncbi:MAG: GMC family oxidoreductase [Burkholderiales bacterium]|nr:GMC family oxidoreductase [Burkholderiales bacterium]